ncbi:hypothetical protein T484DRAFT_1655477, partial [Baffinella frigidus]
MPSPADPHAGSCAPGFAPSKRRACTWEVRPWLLLATLLLASPGWAGAFLPNGLIQLRHAPFPAVCGSPPWRKLPRLQRAPHASAALAQRAQAGEGSRGGAESKGRRDGAAARSAYIHIPFCQQRCFYCDFPVKVVGRSPQEGQAADTIEGYLASLHEEIRRGGGGGFDQEVLAAPLETIYLGGGTPSLLRPAQVEGVLNELRTRFGIKPEAEITMEMDPGTFTAQDAAGFLAAGVKRVSLGVQSFHDDQLQACGRGHTVEQVRQAFEILREAGFQDISIDLISGLPGDTLDSFKESLAAALALNPTHLSVYDLIVEEGTAFGSWYAGRVEPPKERLALPGEDLAGDMYRTASETLSAAGFEHYEVSSYGLVPKDVISDMTPDEIHERAGALSPHRSKHNLVYWTHTPFLAFGMGATSYINSARLKRPPTLPTYTAWVSGGGDAKLLIGEPDLEEESDEGVGGDEAVWDEVVEVFMVGLRMRQGL